MSNSQWYQPTTCISSNLFVAWPEHGREAVGRQRAKESITLDINNYFRNYKICHIEEADIDTNLRAIYVFSTIFFVVCCKLQKIYMLICAIHCRSYYCNTYLYPIVLVLQHTKLSVFVGQQKHIHWTFNINFLFFF